jgi:hypothetical protein
MPELSRFFGIIIRLEVGRMKHGIYRVTSFKIVGPRTLTVGFDDGSSQTIDFSPALQGRLYGSLRDERLFKRVSIDPEVHTLVWPNGADFDPETLHDWPRTSWGAEPAASSPTRLVAESRAVYSTRKGRRK